MRMWKWTEVETKTRYFMSLQSTSSHLSAFPRLAPLDQHNGQITLNQFLPHENWRQLFGRIERTSRPRPTSFWINPKLSAIGFLVVGNNVDVILPPGKEAESERRKNLIRRNINLSYSSPFFLQRDSIQQRTWYFGNKAHFPLPTNIGRLCLEMSRSV